MVSTYDSWKTTAPEAGEDAPIPCPVCTGDSDAPPCGEECDALVKRCARERRIRGLYKAARNALSLARRYRFTEFSAGQFDHRVHSILNQVHDYRQEIYELRRAA